MRRQGEMQKLLITGSKGMLGSALMTLASGRFDASGADLPEFDLTDPEVSSRLLDDRKPDVVINAAAYTDVDGCESGREKAMAVNGDLPGFLAKGCAERGVKLVHFSTDYVFDGIKPEPYFEDDDPDPINIYGESKLAGENAVMEVEDLDYLLVRTAWLFGPGGRNFVDTMIDLASRLPKLEVVNDQRGCPTYTYDLARTVFQCLAADLRGLYHAASDGFVTWYGFAKKIMEFTAQSTPVYPTTSDKLTRPARRPANSVLSTEKLFKVLGVGLPEWEDALRRYLLSKNLFKPLPDATA